MKQNEDNKVFSGQATCLLDVHVIKVVLNKLDTGVEVGRVELIWNVPAERTKLAPLLHNCVQERHTKQHRLPLGHAADVEEVLRHARVRSLQSCLHALWRLVRELDRHLVDNICDRYDICTYRSI